VPANRKIIAAACALAVSAPLGSEAAAVGHAPHGPDRGARAHLRILDRPSNRFHAAITTWRRRHPSPPTGAAGGFAPPESFGVSSATLNAIAACESGGDPTAVSPDGTYRGKYQFDYGTWASMGGHGDPAAAPEAEQDMRAAMLYAQAGASPWPICGQ
jgi:hypothetical protein